MHFSVVGFTEMIIYHYPFPWNPDMQQGDPNTNSIGTYGESHGIRSAVSEAGIKGRCK